ncbi:MAG: flagellar assembly protein J [Methanocella sp. PtaU1.Bin125]|nr:MAG: flagellar assembly protein J [Methanocella sp. PtaU1.Bin125]
MRFPEMTAVKSLARHVASSGLAGGFAVWYGQCRPDRDYADYVYRSILLAVAGFVVVMTVVGVWLLALGKMTSVPEAACPPAAGIAAAIIVFYGRLYYVSSLKSYRAALIDANAIHAVGLMLAMAGYNVPLKRMLRNLSNLGSVYGQDIALEAAYALSLIEEDGMDVISALRMAQASSPSALWQELLIGIAAIYNSGGRLRDYLQGKYESLAAKKALEVRRYNEKVQGMSSIYLSVIGIAAIFIAIINLVFSMAGMLAGDALVWIDALIVVPLGSFVAVRYLQAAFPEAGP